MSDEPALSLGLRVQSALLRVLTALPPGWQRRLAGGRPLERDGLVLEPELQLLLALMARVRVADVVDLGPIEGRREMRRNVAVLGGVGEPLALVEPISIPGPAGTIPARLYGVSRESGPGPLLVYYHGGGWVVGDLETHDGVCRLLAREAGVRVLSVDYRLAPEHRFPAAADDAVAAFRFAVSEAARLGADPRRIAVGGDSAGGNLAAVVSQLCARDAVPPAFQLLIYPATDAAHVHPSRRIFAEGFFLTDRQMAWYYDQYLPAQTQRLDPRASPLLAPDVSGVAPAYVTTAGFDPLRDEGEAYAEKLRKAGVPVQLARVSGQVHGFANMAAALRSARVAMRETARALRDGLAQPPRRGP